MRNRMLAVASAVLCAAAFPISGQAALVQLCGPTVCYEYDNNPVNNPGILKYLEPTLLGGSDVLEFSPTDFLAWAEGPGGTGSDSAVFAFTKIWTQPGYEIGAINVAEYGDYQILNGGLVRATLTLSAMDLVNETAYGLFPENTIDVQIFQETTPTGFAFENWSLTANLTPATAFTDLATVVNLTIGNLLEAESYGSGEFAYIAKKLTLGVSTSVPASQVVPVPAALWLFGPALAMLGVIRRRPQ